jgi:hypothetical protein
MGPRGARIREQGSPFLIHLVRSPLILHIGRDIVLTTRSPFRFETRHKKNLLTKGKQAVFSKSFAVSEQVNSSFFNKQLCFFGSPAVLSSEYTASASVIR